MEIDKKYWPLTVKSISLAVFVVYLIAGNSKLGTAYPINVNGEGYGDAVLKSTLAEGQHCMVLLGGSNVRQGLDAGQMKQDNCTAINLGVASELGTFEQYSGWLKKSRISAAKAVYSSALIWNDSPGVQFSEKASVLDFSITPIGSQLGKIFTPHRKQSNFDSDGDVINSSCEGQASPVVLDNAGFRDANESVAIAIQNRIISLKKVLGTNDVYLRTPPIYTSEQWVQTYRVLIAERLLLLRQKGINVIPQELVVSSDKSLFCENIHPNKAGRTLFTEQLKQNLPI